MKNLKTPIAVLFIAIAAVSCRKTQQEVQTVEQEATPNAVAANTGIAESSWQSPAEWNSVEQPTHTVFYTNIKTSEITADAAEKGMIRVFKVANSGGTSSSVALPFEETNGSQKSYWYYQVTEGNIMIAVDVYGGKANPAQTSLFKHVVLSSDAVSEFESKGTSKADLMELSLDKVTAAGK